MFLSGFTCDTPDCHEQLFFGSDGYKHQPTANRKFVSAHSLMYNGRKRGWSFGSRILCPECRKKFGRPMTKKQVKRFYPAGSLYVNLTDIYTRKEFEQLIIDDGEPLEDFMTHDGYDYGEIYDTHHISDMLRDKNWKYAIRQ